VNPRAILIPSADSGNIDSAETDKKMSGKINIPLNQNDSKLSQNVVYLSYRQNRMN
jgi:hypothetical protein